jgi:hypothetical protein
MGSSDGGASERDEEGKNGKFEQHREVEESKK